MVGVCERSPTTDGDEAWIAVLGEDHEPDRIRCHSGALDRCGPSSRDWSPGDAIEQAGDMTDALMSHRSTQVAVASHVRPGDRVVHGDRYLDVVRVRRAQGRKPARGENLHLVGEDDVIKVNSLDPVRIRARQS